MPPGKTPDVCGHRFAIFNSFVNKRCAADFLLLSENVHSLPSDPL